MSVHQEVRDRGRRANGKSRTATTVLHVGGLHYATEKAVVERVLAGRPGVVAVGANPVAQTATVSFDPAETSEIGRASCRERVYGTV